MSSLTIAIPTYNRNEKLLINLKKILPQITTQKIIIVDNCSDIALEESLGKIIKQYKNISIKVYRNKTNIGIAANFLRCFEYCETEWMWLLSDDDTVCDNAVEIIERDTRNYFDYTFLNYLSSMVESGITYAEVFPIGFPFSSENQLKTHVNYRKENFSTTGVKELIDGIDSFVNFIFVSSGVYNIRKVLPHLRIGYIYAYSLAPHLATVFASVGKEGKVLFSVDKLVWFEPPSSKDTWARLTFSQVITLLLEVPLDLDDKAFEILFHKINHWFMTDDELFHEVNITYKDSNRMKQWLYVQLISRTMFKKRTWKQRVKIALNIIKLFRPKYNTSYKDDIILYGKPPLQRI
jgi:glycosyltransferase involved in cell wall biosynthesis